MKYNCKVCGSSYNYCHHCAITKNLFKNKGYCDEDCYRILQILQQYGTNCISTERAIELLKSHHIESKQLQHVIVEHYKEILDLIKKRSCLE